MGLVLVQRDDELHVVADGPEKRLCEAMGLLNVATAEVVAGSIAEALAGPDWQGDGIVTPEQWLALRCGVTSTRARRLVAVAQALSGLPAAASAFGSGELSEDQVGLVCSHVDPAHDAEVTGLARRCTVNQLRRILPSVVAPAAEPDPEPGTGEEGDAASAGGDVAGRREVAFGNGEDGRGTVDPGTEPSPAGAPPHEAAAAMGLPAPAWEPPHGERLDTKWITWS